jgi:hypothetical protein
MKLKLAKKSTLIDSLEKHRDIISGLCSKIARCPINCDDQAYAKRLNQGQEVWIPIVRNSRMVNLWSYNLIKETLEPHGIECQIERDPDRPEAPCIQVLEQNYLRSLSILLEMYCARYRKIAVEYRDHHTTCSSLCRSINEHLGTIGRGPINDWTNESA